MKCHLLRSCSSRQYRQCSFILAGFLLVALTLLSAPSASAIEIGGTVFTSNTTLTGANTWTSGNVTINTGVTVTVDTGATLTYQAGGGNNKLQGGGLLEVKGQFILNATTAGVTQVDGGTDISVVNGGKLVFKRVNNTAANNKLQLLASSTLLVDNNSVIEADPVSVGVTQATIMTNGGGLSLLGGNPINVLSGQLNIGDDSGTVFNPSVAHDANGTISVASGATLKINAGANQRWGTTATGMTFAGAGKVNLFTPVIIAPGFISVQTSGDNTWNGFGTINSGAELRINAGKKLIANSVSSNPEFGGGGSLEVDGTLEVNGGRVWLKNDGTRLDINTGGTMIVKSPMGGGLPQLRMAGNTAKTTIAGTFIADVASAGITLVGEQFFEALNTVDILDGATIRVAQGTLTMRTTAQFNGVAVPAGTGQTLVAGSYLVNGALNMRGNVGPNKFNTIGANAVVELLGSTPLFDAIDAANALTVNGTLGVQTIVYPAAASANALTVGSTGTLHGGGTIQKNVNLFGDLRPGDSYSSGYGPTTAFANSVGTLTIGTSGSNKNLTMNSGSVLTADINGGVTDTVAVMGAAATGGQLDLNVMSTAAISPYTLINNDGADALTGALFAVGTGYTIFSEVGGNSSYLEEGDVLRLSPDSIRTFSYVETGNDVVLYSDDLACDEDNQPPVLTAGTCPSPILVTDCTAFGGAAVTFTLPTYTDSTAGCTVLNVLCTPPSGSTFPIGPSTVNCTGSDKIHTTGGCSFTVTVQDAAPTAVCAAGPVALPLSDDGMGNITATLNAGTVNSGSYDNCGPLTTALVGGDQTFTCANVGDVVTVTLLVTDNASQTATCSTTVEITDPTSLCCQTTNGGVEICDGLDNDCDGTTDEDSDVATVCGTGVCQSTGVQLCVGGVLQTDTCDPAATNGTACSDGNACTDSDVCNAGTCVSGLAISCDDGNVCTDDSCLPASGCVNANNTASCNDGNACTTADTCSAGACVGGAAPNCDDSNVCTVDSCNTTSGCVNTPGNAGLECRAATGVCDVAEVCDGSNAACPSDVVASNATVCRAAAGVCDATELCDGSTKDCPADAKSTAVCRPSADICDVVESCDGTNNDCPVNGFVSAGTECRASAGVCDVAEQCTGSGAACPSDAKSTAVCRASAGECDVSESCDGSSNDCPVNGFADAGTSCGFAAIDQCDNADTCNGAGACQINHVADGTGCNDGNACSTVDTCQAGACVGGADTTLPSITAPANVTLECPADTSVAANGTATASDNCASVTVSHTDVSVAGCGNTQTITRTWKATDGVNLTATAVQTITVVDTADPSITAPANVTLDLSEAVPAADFAGGSASDSCSTVTISHVDTVASGAACANTVSSVITRTYTATDACGNSASAVQTITVLNESILDCITRSRLHFLGNNSSEFITIWGNLEMTDGNLAPDFRDDVLGCCRREAAYGTVKVNVAGSQVYQNCNIPFNVHDCLPTNNRELWKFRAGAMEKISLRWKDDQQYESWRDAAATPSLVGKLETVFIHAGDPLDNEDYGGETRFYYNYTGVSTSTGEIYIRINGVAVTDVDIPTRTPRCGSGWWFRKNGTTTTFLYPDRLRPGDVIEWDADGVPNNGNELYTQTVLQDTVVGGTYFNAGGRFWMKLPVSGLNLNGTDRSVSVQYSIGTTGVTLVGHGQFDYAFDRKVGRSWKFGPNGCDDCEIED